MCFVAASLNLKVGAGTLDSNLAKRLPRMPWEKAEYFHRILVALSANGEIIPRILFSANKFVRAKKQSIFLVFLRKWLAQGYLGVSIKSFLAESTET